MSRSALMVLSAVGALVFAYVVQPTKADEFGVAPRHAAHARAHVSRHCGRCGCPRVAYVHHRELESTYGLDYDPRNYNTTKPHFYPGRMRSYTQYFVYGVTVPDFC